MNKLQTHITNEIPLVSRTNIHHMDLYEYCTEIEWRRNKMDIALKKQTGKRGFLVWNDHGNNSMVYLSNLWRETFICFTMNIR